jgi:hypothetical protein
VSSFVAEAPGRPPEAAQLACVSLAETASEKLISLTRHTAMEMAGVSRDPDPTLIRHLYDLQMLRGLMEPGEVASLALAAAETDAQEFAGPYPPMRLTSPARHGRPSMTSAPIRCIGSICSVYCGQGIRRTAGI